MRWLSKLLQGGSNGMLVLTGTSLVITVASTVRECNASFCTPDALSLLNIEYHYIRYSIATSMVDPQRRLHMLSNHLIPSTAPNPTSSGAASLWQEVAQASQSQRCSKVRFDYLHTVFRRVSDCQQCGCVHRHLLMRSWASPMVRFRGRATLIFQSSDVLVTYQHSGLL